MMNTTNNPFTAAQRGAFERLEEYRNLNLVRTFAYPGESPRTMAQFVHRFTQAFFDEALCNVDSMQRKELKAYMEYDRGRPRLYNQGFPSPVIFSEWLYVFFREALRLSAPLILGIDR